MHERAPTHIQPMRRAHTHSNSNSSSSKVTTLMFLGKIKGCGHQRYKHISNRHIHIYMETLYGIDRLLPRTRTRIGTISPLRVWICVCVCVSNVRTYKFVLSISYIWHIHVYILGTISMLSSLCALWICPELTRSSLHMHKSLETKELFEPLASVYFFACFSSSSSSSSSYGAQQ